MTCHCFTHYTPFPNSYVPATVRHVRTEGHHLGYLATFLHRGSINLNVACALQFVEALRYEPEGSGFDSRWCHWNSSLTSFWPHYVPGVDSASNRNEYQEYFLGGKVGRCVGLTTLPPSCADCLEIWGPQPPGTLRVCPGIAFPYLVNFGCRTDGHPHTVVICVLASTPVGPC